MAGLSTAPSMSDYIDQSSGFADPIVLDTTQPGGPSLPDLKKMVQRLQADGREVLDQSAGCISLVDEPLDPEFLAFRERVMRGNLRKNGGKGAPVFLRNNQGVYGYDQAYIMEYPEVLDIVAKDIGITTPYEAMSTVSGRAALGAIFFAWKQENDRRNETENLSQKGAIIVPPMAWSGYQPLAKMMGFELIYAPAVSGKGLAETNEGLEAGIALAEERGFRPIAAISINSSNPTGETTEHEETKAEARTCTQNRMTLLIDGFYAPIARAGQKETLGLGKLQQDLTPEELASVAVLVGETKVTDSQKKTAQLSHFTPKDNDQTARERAKDALEFKKACNLYARPDEALTAAALHAYPKGIHEAMGLRYAALEAARKAMREKVGKLVPMVGGDSFYSVLAMVDAEGGTLIRNTEGRPVLEPTEASQTLVDRFGLVQAPGGLFRPGAHNLARATAAVTVETVNRIAEVIQQMLEESNQHG